MLRLSGSEHRHCDGLSRRDFLRVGALGFGGLTLADLLRLQATGNQPARAKSVIYIVLDGGPSHIDMWDLKPDAPTEYRGPFHPIATRLPGVRICEEMPLQAQIMDRMALIRGIRSVENDHFLSEVYSGLPRGAGRRPAFGSVVSRLAGNTSSLPTYVSLNRPATDQFEFEKPYYAGSGNAPFRPFGAALDDLAPVRSVEAVDSSFREKCPPIGSRESFKSIAFPLIGAGSGGFNQEQAKALMLDELSKVEVPMTVKVVVFKGAKTDK